MSMHFKVSRLLNPSVSFFVVACSFCSIKLLKRHTGAVISKEVKLLSFLDASFSAGIPKEVMLLSFLLLPLASSDM